MKRSQFPATLLVMLLLFSAVILMQVVEVTEANWLGPLPDPNPSVYILSPIAGKTYFQKQISLNLDVTLPFLAGLSEITYRLDQQADVSISGKSGRGNSIKAYTIIECSVTVEIPSDGCHVLHVTVNTSNEEATGKAVTSVTFFVDACPPAITVILPKNETYLTTEVPLNFTVSEKVEWMGYSIDGQPTVTLNNELTKLDGLSFGQHNLTVYANDTVGRLGKSKQIYFTIMQETTPEPQPENQEPSLSPSVANDLLPIFIRMPVEYINYTVTKINGSLWAKVDGTYPMQLLYETTLDDASFSVTSDEIPMLYPTPPSTTNISITMDETELAWSNYTQVHPDATHHTALGDWPMISTTIQPGLNPFTLKIHYEHPIELVNGNYTFLYDLNISPYLSLWSNKSTAYFNIKFETNYTDLNVNTIATNGTLNPVGYTITSEDETDKVTLQIVSEYSKPLLGDLLISFTEDKSLEQTSSSYSASGLPTEYALVAVILTATVALASYLSLKHKNKMKKNE